MKRSEQTQRRPGPGSSRGPAVKPDQGDRVSIFRARTAAHMAEARELFREYEAFLGVDLCFQGFEEELKMLPGKYAPPEGALLLASVDGAIAGCVALRPLEPGVCEMKRLYVRPAHRGLRLGQRLSERVVAEARRIGYDTMKLDTFEFLEAAIHIYTGLGFTETGCYYHNPHERVMYWQLDLTRR